MLSMGFPGVKSAPVATRERAGDLAGMRIASLLASATEIVFALGADDQLVAISHECDYPPEALTRPRVSRPRFDPSGLSSGAIDAAVREAMAIHGSVYELDAEALRAAHPDVLLAQEVCEVCAVPTSLARRAGDLLDPAPRVVSLDAHTVDGILDTITQVGDVAGVPERAAELVAELRARIAEVERRVAGRPRPRVLALEWLDPVFVPGHWGPEMIARAGGENLFGEAGRRSQQVPWDALADADPDVLLVLPCGYGLDAARAEADRHAERLHEIAGRAIVSGRAWVLDGSSYFNRSGPRVVDGIEILGAILHPEAVHDVELVGRAEKWSATGGNGR
jgi:iron complex transport system substrate-binding protein